MSDSYLVCDRSLEGGSSRVQSVTENLVFTMSEVVCGSKKQPLQCFIWLWLTLLKSEALLALYAEWVYKAFGVGLGAIHASDSATVC